MTVVHDWNINEIEFLKAGFKRTIEKTYQDTGAKNEKEKVHKRG